jgi:dihydrofolate reductase
MEKIIIVAVGENGVIGRDGELPWEPIEEDIKFFRQKTIGNTVVMGRKTYQSLPESFRPLPDRENMVLTRSGFEPENESVKVVNSLEEAWSSSDNQKVYIIGGASIYGQALPEADKMFITEVPGEYDGDTFFPDFSSNWEEVSREKGEKVTFVRYEK